MLTERIQKAKTLIEGLYYIKKFYGKFVVVKYGGSIMDNERLRNSFAEDIVLLKHIGLNPIIVHGGGKEISRWMSKLEKEAVFIDGLRVTDKETMEITEMVLSGKINKDLTSLMNEHGGKAVGLSGKDGNLFTAEKIKSKDGCDLGLVGDVAKTDASILYELSDGGYIPVVSSVGISKERETLNMNADTAAAALASAVGAHKLIYLTDVEGILIKEKLLEKLTLQQAEELLSEQNIKGDIKGGMLPKLESSINALRAGVEAVHILSGMIEHSVLLELFTDLGIGTMITSGEDERASFS